MAKGVLDGTVVDFRTREPVVGASISSKGEGGPSNTVPSGDGGKWRIPVPVGTYELTASANGYEETRVTDIPVRENVTTTLPLVMHPLGYFDNAMS